MSRIDEMIGRIVTAGYMATYHEEHVYLHDSQGKRWAEIEPFGMGMSLTIGNTTHGGLETTQQLLDKLQEVEG